MNETIPRSDHYYRLWLVLVTVAARGEVFAPTPEEQVEITYLTNLLGTTDDALARLRSTARRFSQVQNELATLTADERAFTDCTQLVRDLHRQLSVFTREMKQKILAAELRQHTLANNLLRGGALRRESEIIQRSMALEGRR